MTILRPVCALFLAAVLSGCAADAEREFGSSVRHMLAGQKDDPSPASQERSSTDGTKAANAVDAYHAPKVEPGQLSRPPHGGGQHSVPVTRGSTPPQ